MDYDFRKLVDAYYTAGKTQVECAELLNELNLNGQEEETLEYLHTIYERKIEEYPLTDAGNAEYFAECFGENLRYDHSRGRWLRWYGNYWKPDDDQGIMRLALKSIRNRFKDAAHIENIDKKKDTVKWLIGSEQRTRMDALIHYAKAFHPITDSGKDWDKNNWLFCVANGVIDMTDLVCRLREGYQRDKITMQSPVEYDPSATAPRWESFLNEIFNGDDELIKWWKRYAGYCLTGITKEQIVPIGYGIGANGKSVLKEVMLYIFGDYGYDAPFSTFELYNRAAIPNDLAALAGKRFVTASETNQGTRLNEARVKALTGGDSITARFLNQEYFTFQPNAKFFLAVNHRPRVADDSYGFWRRVRLVPFTRQFIGSDEDRDLKTNLIEESSGILNWMIDGFHEWVITGLGENPSSITNATEEYKTESNPLADFVMERCVISSQAQVSGKDLYGEYKNWCEEQGYQGKEILTNNAFGRRMGQAYKKMHGRTGTIYQGIGLLSDGFNNQEELPINTGDENGDFNF